MGGLLEVLHLIPSYADGEWARFPQHPLSDFWSMFDELTSFAKRDDDKQCYLASSLTRRGAHLVGLFDPLPGFMGMLQECHPTGEPEHGHPEPSPWSETEPRGRQGLLASARCEGSFLMAGVWGGVGMSCPSALLPQPWLGYMAGPKSSALDRELLTY